MSANNQLDCNIDSSVSNDFIKLLKNQKFTIESRLNKNNGLNRNNSITNNSINRQTNKKVIGQGSYGTIYICQDNFKKCQVAIKQLDLIQAERSNALKSIEIEIQTLEQITLLNEFGFTKFHDIECTPKQQQLQIEYVNGDSLENKLKKFKIQPHFQTIQILACILKNIEILHNHGFIHRDLKPQNVMIEKNGFVKVIDFGTVKIFDKSKHSSFLEQLSLLFPYNDKSRNDSNIDFDSDSEDENSDFLDNHVNKIDDIINNISISGSTKPSLSSSKSDNSQKTEAVNCFNDVRSTSSTFVGTESYICPELLLNNEVNPSGDIWAFGCIMYRMYSGNDAFPSDSINPMVTFKKIENVEYDLSKVENEDVKEVLKGILVKDPRNRWDIDTIKKHRLFKDINFRTLINESVFTFDENEQEQDLNKNKGEDKSFNQFQLDDFQVDDYVYKISSQIKNSLRSTLELDEDLNNNCANELQNKDWIMRECVLKKDKYMKHKRWLQLTQDNLYQKDEHDIIIKGQIQLEKSIKLELINENKFIVINSQKKYKIQTQNSASKWVENIKKVLESKNNN